MGFLEKLRTYDRLWIGIVIAVILPALLYPILRPLNPQNFGFITSSYNQAMLKLLPMLLSRCVFPNALLFFLLIWNNFDQTAKGVLYSTVALTGVLVLIQIIF